MPHSSEIASRVALLREWMSENGLSAYVVPSTDPHCGEYVPDRWKVREWISGFDGSAGTAVVTLTRAALWTDSRYWLAAEAMTAGTPFAVVRCSRNEATGDELAAWIAGEGGCASGSYVGLDGWTSSETSVTALKHALQQRGLVLDAEADAASVLWAARPQLPSAPVEIHPERYAGRSVADKLAAIRAAVAAEGAEALLVTQLDEVAWALNLRGSDVHCTPLFVAYLLVKPEGAVLSIDAAKVSAEVRAYLEENGVALSPYGTLPVERSMTVLYDPATTNVGLLRELGRFDVVRSDINLHYVTAPSPIAAMKAVKTDAEVGGYRRAMLRDGVAMVRFLRWLRPAVERGEVTEVGVAERLLALRGEQELFRGPSFDTIAGYGPHAAIVHYEATPQTDVALEPRGLLLVDSGGQYLDGTTDITRTVALGPLTDDERRDYTLVLRGFLRLSMAVFPDATSGTQLDVLARAAMWREHKNYGHGTGHGVGSYLSVHEGPHQFRTNWMPAPLHANMTVTVEPGIYVAGSHGARTENTMLIVADGENEHGRWLRLDPLTLCPIDTTPILWDMLLPDEVEYLNNYHARVREALLPLLDDPGDREWLVRATERIDR